MPDYLHALPAGYRLDEYELVRVLGSGGQEPQCDGDSDAGVCTD